MATYTSHYNLKKPDTTDPVDVADLNGNADIIDQKIFEASQSGGSSAMIEPSVEASATSAHAYAVGEHFIYNDTLYRATAAISIGDTITPDTNCVATTVAGELEGKVDKVTGKQLSTEDYTTAEKTKLSGIEAQANKTVIDDTLTNTGEAADAKTVGDEIGDVKAMIESSAETSATSAHAYAAGDHFIYNGTLYRATAAIAIGDTITPESNCVATTVMAEVEAGGGGGGTSDYTQLSNKPQINGHTLAGNQTGAQLGLVDAVSGKGLSSNDYTTAEKEKLESVASGAEANVQSDWNQADSTADDYVKNRTHYSENTYTTLLTKSTSQHSGSTYTSIGTGTIDSEFYVPGSSNNSFEITYNGQTTNGHFGNGQGSNTYYWYTLITDDDLGVKLIQYSENSPAGWRYTYDITATGTKPASTFVLKKLSSTTVHKLDNKYLDTATSPTSESTKPITAGGVYTALAGKINTSAKGAANGVASLDANGKVIDYEILMLSYRVGE